MKTTRGIAIDSRYGYRHLDPLPTAEKFSALTLLNVLEHARDPEEILLSVRSLLHVGGVIAVRVPNIFPSFKRLRNSGSIARCGGSSLPTISTTSISTRSKN